MGKRRHINTCYSCGKQYDRDANRRFWEMPRCSHCGYQATPEEVKERIRSKIEQEMQEVKEAQARAGPRHVPWYERANCENCGKRLKYKPGSWAYSDRYPVCRACGHRQSWAPG
jgi:DNA-directed RNA polymerase subunit RPC12/RpoP